MLYTNTVCLGKIHHVVATRPLAEIRVNESITFSYLISPSDLLPVCRTAPTFSTVNSFNIVILSQLINDG